MPTLLERAARWTKDRMDRTASIPVTVRDGNEACEGIMAIPGQTSFSTYNLDEFTGTAKSFDWCVEASELIFNGQRREPKKGWEVRQLLDDGRTAVYLAVADGGSRCYDVMDQTGLLYRIHTKLDRIESA